MILYLVYDKKNNTCTSPTVVHTFLDAQEALKEINPENLSDLILHEICTINSIYDFFLLSPNENKNLPDFLINRSDDSSATSTQQAEGAVASHYE